MAETAPRLSRIRSPRGRPETPAGPQEAGVDLLQLQGLGPDTGAVCVGDCQDAVDLEDRWPVRVTGGGDLDVRRVPRHTLWIRFRIREQVVYDRVYECVRDYC